jgi:polysaccharide pyruvyl transferase WcaK-like protein
MKRFIVTGIQMKNKGSQAMFCTLWHSLKSIHGECEVIGFANKYESPEVYSFTLLPHDDFTRPALKLGLQRVPVLASTATFFASRIRKKDKWNGKLVEMNKALREADAILDASGYTLGSGWPKGGGRRLLETVRLAKKYNKKIILMPQSFGPFDWGESDDAAFLEEVKEELKYCSKIYAREKEGYQCLTSLGLTNVELSADMVIRQKDFPTVSEIYSKPRNDAIEYPDRGSVGLIINENLLRIGDSNSALELYRSLLKRLWENGEKVYILNTSGADNYLVDSLLQELSEKERIIVLSGDYSSPELIELISCFKFIVASRYHSIIFAYRNCVPAVIIGWASKYKDLAEHFGQDEYVFDIRTVDEGQVLNKIDKMISNFEEESKQIGSRLSAVQESSVVLDAMNAL